MPFSHLSYLECARCARRADADAVHNLCACGGPLLARYDLERVRRELRRDELREREPTLWRYHELLPVRDPGHVVSLGEGMTPLIPLARLGRSIGLPRLLMKDEGLVPSGTFKARGAAVGVSRAAELGVKGIAMPTNGNAGAAWSLYAARAGVRSVIAMPLGAPVITRAECAVSGAELYLVDGDIGAAAREIAGIVAGGGGALLDVSTLKEPYRVEGKKTMGYELFEQLDWRCPDVIVYPTGGGVGLIGIHKALGELRALGWIGDRLPRLVVVQPAGCAPIVRAFEAGAAAAEPWADPSTVAFGLTVPAPLGDFLVLEALRATGGTAVAVDDDAILAEQANCARLEGAFVCPEGAAALAAARLLRASDWLAADESVVVLNTGAGIKYPETVRVEAPTLGREAQSP